MNIDYGVRNSIYRTGRSAQGFALSAHALQAYSARGFALRARLTRVGNTSESAPQFY
jgi:hypothetical protein